MSEHPHTFAVELRPTLPEKLRRLDELASDLMYSWDRRIRGLFWRLDRALWRACGNNPKLFLRRVAQGVLDAAAEDPDFLEDYYTALASFDIYHARKPSAAVLSRLDPRQDLVAYFSAEYGIHESVPIYSGGLGILAADHCKAASDLQVPLVAVGLFYRQGYFSQRIDAAGRQQAVYAPVTHDDLPIAPARTPDGQPLRVSVPIAGREVQLQAWEARVGHIRLVLLDCDVPENANEDRSITWQLYGGGPELRIRQEIVLGIGGVRALRAMGLAPSVWHINEGHAALQLLERIRERVAAGLDFDSALEWVAAETVFTTHTPVAAGHDRFPHALLHEVLGSYLGALGASADHVLALGAEPHSSSFNMTALALRASRFANGVSRIHRGVAAEMERYVWPEISATELPLHAITNGVHLSTFLARAWTQLFHDSFREWTKHLLDVDYWRRIDQIPYHRFVSVRQALKRDLLGELLERVERQHRRNGTPEATLARVTRHIRDTGNPALVMGFARRFATYKRATLLLRDRQRLARLLNDPEHPAILIYAGKAHPRDEPGQALIRELYEASMQPDLIGRLIVVEGYDIAFARHLVQGCDVWINVPEYPLEACGTSGMKAGVNGVINVSVLDGWWPEGYDGSNGFAVTPVGAQHDPGARWEEEARQLLDILQHQVVPLYYGGAQRGWSEGWVQLCRNAMKTLIPRFNSHRMLLDYLEQAYGPASRRGRQLGRDGGSGARELAEWKRRILTHWGRVRLHLGSHSPPVLQHGQEIDLHVRVDLHGLAAQDIAVECLLGRPDADGHFVGQLATRFPPGRASDAHADFHLRLQPFPGLQQLRIRAYPTHPLQAHPFELGRMVWL